MTFDATERSALGSPVEFLTFRNGADQWRYTTSNREETIGVRVFEPLAYRRTEPSYSKDSSDGQVKITVPSTIPLVTRYELMPAPQTTTITIERRHRNDPGLGVQIYWQGIAGSLVRNGFDAIILGIPLTNLPAQIPRYAYSALCNWFLYADRCGIDRNAFKYTGNASAVAGVLLTVDGLRTGAAALDALVSGALTSTELDNYWLGGYAENAAGERRTVYATNVDAVPDKIRILQPFADLSSGQDVTVFAGCTRARDICHRKFANSRRHGGFPDIPPVNVFDTELPTATGSPDRKVFFGN